MHSAFSQNPLVKIWDNRFGGDEKEWISFLQQTTDSGFIIGGESLSGISGDKTQSLWGNTDYWIVKTDSLGNMLWDKDFGGTDKDGLYSIQQTDDGGFILGGYSYSGISGNKTQATWGLSDYWIIKTDSIGNMLWDKDLGGLSDDFLSTIQKTNDGGFILGGTSASGISGDKTEASQGSWDYWIVKTDSLGNKLWDKDFGGTDEDYLNSIQQTTDGGYILGGLSTSGIGGDKTQGSWGGWDYWIVKTDSLGNKEWDKDFGGGDFDRFVSILQTADGGFILGGISESGIGGDKTQPSWGDYDYWIVKTDSLGNKQWDKDLGGANPEDEFGTIVETMNGGYLISGNSYSQISGNKTESNLGNEQLWVIELDASGNVLWDKTIFTPGHDENGFAIQAMEGCYTMVNSSNGGIAGYKSQDSWSNSYDFWLVKFCPTTEAAFTSPSSVCPGSCIDFMNLSFGATSYQWNFPGAVPDTSTAANPQNICYADTGNYDVQLIVVGSSGSDTLLLSNYITVFPFPSPQGIMQSGDTLFANQGAGSYQWYFNGNVIPGATEYFYVATSSGNYNLIVTDQNGCEVEAVINDVIAGTQYTVDSKQLTIYPNPVTESLSVIRYSRHGGQALTGTAKEISIFNVMGEKINVAVDLELMTVDCRLLSKGIYYLEIISGEKIYRTKFIKQ